MCTACRTGNKGTDSLCSRFTVFIQLKVAWVSNREDNFFASSCLVAEKFSIIRGQVIYFQIHTVLRSLCGSPVVVLIESGTSLVSISRSFVYTGGAAIIICGRQIFCGIVIIFINLFQNDSFVGTPHLKCFLRSNRSHVERNISPKSNQTWISKCSEKTGFGTKRIQFSGGIFAFKFVECLQNPVGTTNVLVRVTPNSLDVRITCRRRIQWTCRNGINVGSLCPVIRITVQRPTFFYNKESTAIKIVQRDSNFLRWREPVFTGCGWRRIQIEVHTRSYR